MKNNVIQIDGKYYQECEVVMLPTESNQADIFKVISADDKYKLDYKFATNFSKKDYTDAKYQHLYIISNEEIKEGDWFIATEFDIIGQLLPTDIRGEEIIYKIIATTDKSLGLPRPSNEFIQKYVELQGKIDEVLVEVVDVSYPDLEGEISQPKHYQLKVAPDNTITIRPVETKKDIFSREEVRKILLDFAPFARYDAEEGKWTNIVDNWIKENL